MSTAYTILGVARNATQEQIAEAFRARCAESHPDRAKDDADRVARTARMSKLTLAKRYLGDPEARAKYDRRLLDLSKIAAAPEHAETSAADDISIDAFLGRMRGGNLGVAVAEVARQHGLVDQPGFARVQMAADKAGEISKGLVDLIGLVRGR